MAKSPGSSKKPQTAEEALAQLAGQVQHGDESEPEGSASLTDLVAAAKAPTTAGAAAVSAASRPATGPQKRKPETTAEAKARVQRGLELLTSVTNALNSAAKTIDTSGKHTRSAIDNTFKLALEALQTSVENVKRSADSVASTNNRLAATNKALVAASEKFAAATPGQITESLSELEKELEQIRDIRKAAAVSVHDHLQEGLDAIASRDRAAMKEMIDKLDGILEGVIDTVEAKNRQSAKELTQEFAKFPEAVERRMSKWTILILVTIACCAFAALCSFATVLTLLLK